MIGERVLPSPAPVVLPEVKVFWDATAEGRRQLAAEDIHFAACEFVRHSPIRKEANQRTGPVAATRCGLSFLRQASTRKRRSNLADNLIHRPVPRCNQPAHPNRFLPHQGRASHLLELKLFEHSDRFQQMPQPRRNLPLPRQCDRRSDLRRNRLRHFFRLRLIPIRNSPQQREPIFHRRLRVRLKGLPRRRHRLIHLSPASQRNSCDRFLRGGIDHGKFPVCRRSDPFAIDKK